ncbi:MAG: ABC transporter ATP-binding protein [Prevotellaceae bacterium]|jgi:ABC-type lipoprotein export system ATPase subunit|nr:ABC transporter ATP-binding protein [Prevotellaceae bacterium]
MSLLSLSGIAKSYKDGENNINHVLRSINLELEAGDFVAVKGASGAGKTTLLQIIGTLIKPDAGSYLLDGVEMSSSSVDFSYIRNKKTGFVFQDYRLMPQYRIRENILLPTLAFQNKTSEEQNDYALKLMEITGIQAIAEQYPDTVSGGEASRAALCRALIMKPLLLLADEPTGQLDSENVKNIAAMLSEINKILNTTIIMVTHSDEISSVAKRILTLKNGILT